MTSHRVMCYSSLECWHWSCLIPRGYILLLGSERWIWQENKIWLLRSTHLMLLQPSCPVRWPLARAEVHDCQSSQWRSHLSKLSGCSSAAFGSQSHFWLDSLFSHFLFRASGDSVTGNLILSHSMSNPWRTMKVMVSTPLKGGRWWWQLIYHTLQNAFAYCSTSEPQVNPQR